MKSIYVIETVEELLGVFAECREEGDTTPSALEHSKLVYLPMTRQFEVTGNGWQLGEALRDEKGAKLIFQHLAKQSGISIEWAG